MLLHDMLRDQLEAEEICEDRLRRIATSPLLTDDERKMMREQADEEVIHQKLITSCIKRYEPLEPRMYRGIDERMGPAKLPYHDPALMLGEFQSVERLMRRSLRSTREIFRQNGDWESVKVYDVIIMDEDAHRGANKRVFNRLQTLPEIGDEITARYHTCVKEHYALDAFKAAMEANA